MRIKLNLLRQSYATHGSYPDRHATLLSKKLEGKGLISLTTHKGAGNIKYLSITENGVSFANKYITPLTNADISSFSSFTDEERELLLSLMQRQLDYLKKGTEGLWK